VGEEANGNLLSRIKVAGRIPEHIAIIMDGNGRWAGSRGLPRFRGHTAGMKSVREVTEGCIDAGVRYLTLYAFSQENWQRPKPEVAALMKLFERYVAKERAELVKQGVEVKVFGEHSRITGAPRRAMDAIEAATAGGLFPGSSIPREYPIPTFSSVHPVSFASATSCSGNSPTPSSTSRPYSGRNSTAISFSRRFSIIRSATGGSAE
jgi:hypothetical protein